MGDYRRLGYFKDWINHRLKSIEIRKDLTEQWKAHNVEEGIHYTTLTDVIYQTLKENAQCAHEGGTVAAVARRELESKTG